MKVIGGNFVRTLHINWIDWQDINQDISQQEFSTFFLMEAITNSYYFQT